MDLLHLTIETPAPVNKQRGRHCLPNCRAKYSGFCTEKLLVRQVLDCTKNLDGMVFQSFFQSVLALLYFFSAFFGSDSQAQRVQRQAQWVPSQHQLKEHKTRKQQA
jgi:hypothetical protein